MATAQYLSRWINKRGESVDVFQVDAKGKEFEVRGPGRSSSHFYGDYAQLLKKLKSEGYESKSRHEETETIDAFMDKVLSEADAKLKPGQKKKIPTTIKVKLSPAAQAALKADPKTAEQKKKIEAELKKHEEEFKKLNALLNQARKKKDELRRAKKQLGSTISPLEAKYFSLIDKECSQFLKDMKTAKYFLYRGMNSVGDVIYGKPHEKRRAMDTNQSVQTRLDQILKSAGFKALRSNSIFTSGDSGQAENYGDLYIIFPKNGYSFTWSQKHGDWVPTMGDMNVKGDAGGSFNWNDVYNLIEDFISAFEDPEEFWYSYDDAAKAAKVKKVKAIPLFKSLKSGLTKMYNHIEELDTWADEEPTEAQQASYLITLQNLLKLNKQITELKLLSAVQVNKVNRYIDIIKKSKAKSGVLPKEFVNKFITKHGMKNTDMPAALKSNHEIYINGEYIALEYDKFRKSAAKYFLNGDVKNYSDYNDDWDDEDDDDEDY